MENQHKHIQGYRDLTQVEIDMINDIKQAEAIIAGVWWSVRGNDDADARELAIARTHFEQAFMHLVKSVAKPDTPWQQ